MMALLSASAADVDMRYLPRDVGLAGEVRKRSLRRCPKTAATPHGTSDRTGADGMVDDVLAAVDPEPRWLW
jgi:hypothetical protein